MVKTPKLVTKRKVHLKTASNLKTKKFKSKFDVLGSYTGIADNNEIPTQDADDL